MVRANLSQRWPSNPTELGQVMADREAFASMFPNAEPQAFEDFADSYARSSPHIKAMVAQREQAAVGDFMRKHPVNGSGGFGGVVAGEAAGRDGSGRNRLYNRNAPGAAVDHVLASAGDDRMGTFLRLLTSESAAGIEARAALQASNFRNAMSERVPSQGGFLVPELLRSEMLVAQLEKSIVRQRARVVPMDSLRIPYPAIDDTTHVGSVFGGIQANWTEEGATLSPSQPAFERIVLEAKKLTFYTDIPNELLEDETVNLEMWLGDQVPAALSFFEDVAFLTGTGTGAQPQGVLNAPGAVQFTRTGGAGKVVWADLVGMYARLLPQSFTSPSTCWVCSPDVLPQLLQMAANDVKSATAVAPPLWLSGMQGITERPERLMGYPVCVSEKLPTLGTTGDLILVDWAFYLLGIRQEMQAAVSHEFKFANDLTSFRFIERVDGRLWLQSPITQESGSTNTLSAAILLH